MKTIIERIKQAGAEEINDIFMTALQRYRELFPDWDVCTISLEKAVDKNAQLDRIIDFLEQMKEK